MNKQDTNGMRFIRDDEFQPIINSPYGVPSFHYEVNEDMKVIAIKTGRRLAANMPAVAGSRARGRRRLRASSALGRDWDELKLVNDVRERVEEWREAGYPGATYRTRELIRYWTESGEDSERESPLYFAQLDAVLSHIYLKEIDGGEITERLSKINGRYNNGVDRICHKMATGSGKTLVMAMLIVWHTANKIAYPEDGRFTSRFLCLTPGITVRERLSAALAPSAASNDYENFALLPPGEFWEGMLGRAAVYVVNSHQLKPKSAWLKLSTTARAVLNGGANPMSEDELAAQQESMREVIARVAGSVDEPIMVINDESHHCHRGDPNKDPVDTDWFSGLEAIRDCGALLYVADLSATPTYIVQSNPEPVDWIVSDYSLLDAIEAGLVKIPRVPVREERASGPNNEAPRWRNIFDRASAKERADFDPARTDNNQLLKGAFRALYDDYAATNEAWERTAIGKPPVMAIVMNKVANANKMFRYIAENMADAPLLSNEDMSEPPRAIIVHSRMDEGVSARGDMGKRIRELAERFRAADLGFTALDKPEEIIRRVMNTVGKRGQPGEHVRCVISVGMLTEGWDAQTVTHLLGFRKFDSSLLCEQVAGRTLRRVTHERDDNDMFGAEYAQILGVPFPQYTDANGESKLPSGSRAVSVEAREDTHADKRIYWPNIVGYNRRANPYGIIDATNRERPEGRYRIGLPNMNPTKLEPVVGEELTLGDAPAGGGMRHSLYLIAAEAKREALIRIQDQVGVEEGDLHESVRHGRLFAQILGAARRYAADGYLLPGDLGGGRDYWPDGKDLAGIYGAGVWLAANLDISYENRFLKGDKRALVVMTPVASRARPWRHTGELRPYMKALWEDKMYGETDKSEINWADCDSGWEREVARVLDEMPKISAWARNHRLGWSIPYVDEGEIRRYLPDFVAAVDVGGINLRLVIEVKGEERPSDKIKRRWAEGYWIPGINESREFGETAGYRWEYVYLGEREYSRGIEARLRERIDMERERHAA